MPASVVIAGVIYARPAEAHRSRPGDRFAGSATGAVHVPLRHALRRSNAQSTPTTALHVAPSCLPLSTSPRRSAALSLPALYAARALDRHLNSGFREG